jgi:glucose/arabinose dehydrogenase
MLYTLSPVRLPGAVVLLVATLAAGCASESATSERTAEPVVGSDARSFETELYPIRVVTLAEGLVFPYSMTFLPDGSMLLTELEGRMRLVRNGVLQPDPIPGTPEVYYVPSRGGLMDVILHPDFAENHWVYFTYDKSGERGATPAVARGTLEGNQLNDVIDIFVSDAWGTANGHLSSYIRFTPDGMLFMSTAERNEPIRSQDTTDHAGKLLRLHDDGSVPADNPFVGREGFRPEIYAYGHRDIHGMTVHPDTGEVWTNEHGDEVNIARPGLNYGWPYVAVRQTGEIVPAPEGLDLTAPYLTLDTRIVQVSGMTFYTGNVFPEWRGDLFISGLAGEQIHRVSFAEDPPDTSAPAWGKTREILFPLGAQVRDVREGPDGLLYFVTNEENGRLMRIEPAE